MTMLNYTKIENYIYWVEQKMHNKSMEKDIKYIKAILIKLKMYGKVGWFETNKVMEILSKFEKMYPK